MYSNVLQIQIIKKAFFFHSLFLRALKYKIIPNFRLAVAREGKLFVLLHLAVAIAFDGFYAKDLNNKRKSKEYLSVSCLLISSMCYALFKTWL